ncbi:MAG: hypothetical protein ACKOHK_13130, partial [Planctomycetia bacterium]
MLTARSSPDRRGSSHCQISFQTISRGAVGSSTRTRASSSSSRRASRHSRALVSKESSQTPAPACGSSTT